MSSIRNWVVKFARDERGMETVEWGVLAALVVAGLVGIIGTLGTHVNTRFTQLRDATS
jgi:Flp pilus assembly pilin Flp